MGRRSEMNVRVEKHLLLWEVSLCDRYWVTIQRARLLPTKDYIKRLAFACRRPKLLF